MIMNGKISRKPKDQLIGEKSVEALKEPAPTRVPLTADQQALAMRYLPLAKSLAKKLKLDWPNESDEFDSAACLALVEAAQSYNPNRNVRFATFARFRIWGALRDVQRALIASGWHDDIENAPLLNSLLSEIEELGCCVIGSTPDRPVGEEDEMVEAVEAWLRKLPPKHAEACRQIYLNDRTQSDAAKIIGCSKSRLSYLHKESLERLNEAWHARSEKQREFMLP
jgi:RNA polymerase sigma factor (sigma-70 family)